MSTSWDGRGLGSLPTERAYHSRYSSPLRGGDLRINELRPHAIVRLRGCESWSKQAGTPIWSARLDCLEDVLLEHVGLDLVDGVLEIKEAVDGFDDLFLGLRARSEVAGDAGEGFHVGDEFLVVHGCLKAVT